MWLRLRLRPNLLSQTSHIPRTLDDISLEINWKGVIALDLTLQLLPNNFAICKLAPNMEIPSWLNSSSLFSITRTSDELSIVCEDSIVSPGICTESGWACLKVVGTIDFSLIGIYLPP